MHDAELSELVRKFQAVQNQEVPNQIGERNVVEIINVLRSKKLLDLIYTTDGKEYLTWDQLRREVVDEVFVNGGRMNVVDLPGALNVHVTHVERVLPEVLEGPGMRLESGELLTDDYLDTTVRAAADVLKERGFLSIVDFAKTHHFTSLFAQDILTRAVASRELRAVMKENALYTRQFVHAQKLILRAGLLAATRPVNLAVLFERHDLFKPLMDPIVEEVRGEIPGRVEGGVYVPSHFEAARAREVENIYTSNGCIEYAALQRLGMAQAREYLVVRFNPPAERTAPTKRRGRRAADAVDTAPVRATDAHPHAGHVLSGCFVADRLLSSLVALEELVHGDAAAVDLAAHLPPAVDWERDGAALLPRLRELFPVLSACFIASGGVCVLESAREAATARLRTALEREAPPKATRRAADDGRDETPAFRCAVAETLALGAAHDAAVDDVAAHWRAAADALSAELRAAAAELASVDGRRARAALQSALTAAWLELCAAGRGAAWAAAQLDAAAAQPVGRQLLAAVGGPLARDLLRIESLDPPTLHAAVRAALEAEDGAALGRALRLFPEARRAELSPAVEAAGRSVESFADALSELCAAGRVAVAAFHAPNKRAEREAHAALRNKLKERVAANAFTADTAHSGPILAAVCALLVDVQFRVYVEVPGRSVAAVAARLAAEADAVDGLVDAQRAVAAAIASGAPLSAEEVATLERIRQDALKRAA